MKFPTLFTSMVRVTSLNIMSAKTIHAVFHRLNYAMPSLRCSLGKFRTTINVMIWVITTKGLCSLCGDKSYWSRRIALRKDFTASAVRWIVSAGTIVVSRL